MESGGALPPPRPPRAFLYYISCIRVDTDREGRSPGAAGRGLVLEQARGPGPQGSGSGVAFVSTGSRHPPSAEGTVGGAAGGSWWLWERD